MPHWGGRRANAGRKAGVPNLSSRLRHEARDALLAIRGGPLDPVIFLIKTAANEKVGLAERIKCATKAAPFVYPKLTHVAADTLNTDLKITWDFSGRGLQPPRKVIDTVAETSDAQPATAPLRQRATQREASA
jgi:hypothetical protein